VQPPSQEPIRIYQKIDDGKRLEVQAKIFGAILGVAGLIVAFILLKARYGQ
jgi:hypothetical protein